MSWPPKIGEPPPNADQAHGVHDKLTRYSLQAGHPRRKAEAFARVLAVTADDLEYLASAIIDGARQHPVSEIREDGDYGVHCEVIVPVRGHFAAVVIVLRMSLRPGRSGPRVMHRV